MSGPGLVNAYSYVVTAAGMPLAAAGMGENPADICLAAGSGDELAQRAIEIVVGAYGAALRTAALHTMAYGVSSAAHLNPLRCVVFKMMVVVVGEGLYFLLPSFFFM